MGIYSSSQFLGIFAGGSLAGLLYQFAGSRAIFFANMSLGLIWIGIAASMNPNVYQTTLILNYPKGDKEEGLLTQALSNLAGVQGVRIAPDEGCIYMRVNKADYLPGSAEACLLAFSA